MSEIWLCYFLVPINIYGDFIEKSVGISSLYVNAISIAIYFILCMINKRKSNKWCKNILLFLFVNIVIVAAHFIYATQYSDEIKHILYILLFVNVANRANQETFSRIKKVILALTIPMTIDALYWLPRIKKMGLRLFNIRNYTMIDKTFYTLIFPIALIILFNLFLEEKKNKKRFFQILWMCALLYIIFSVVESKTGILAFGFSIVIEIFALKKGYRRQIRRLTIIGLTAITIMIVLTSLNILNIPDYVKAAATFIRGNYSAVNSVYYETYFTRLEILRNGFSVFAKYPLLGVGFGGYYPYVYAHGMQNYSIGIMDVESAALAIIVEGGLLYLLSNISLYYEMISKLKKKYQYIKDVASYIGIFSCILFLLLGNDFMNIFYWVILGTLYGTLRRLSLDGRISEYAI